MRLNNVLNFLAIWQSQSLRLLIAWEKVKLGRIEDLPPTLRKSAVRKSHDDIVKEPIKFLSLSFPKPINFSNWIDYNLIRITENKNINDS